MTAAPFDMMDADLDWIRPAVSRVMNEYPELSADGFKHLTSDYKQADFDAAQAKMLTADFAKQIFTAWDFVRGTYLEKYGSYTLKHAAERFGKVEGLESYVSNGALIVAAILRGYKPKREKSSPNCTFLRNGKYVFRPSGTR